MRVFFLTPLFIGGIQSCSTSSTECESPVAAAPCSAAAVGIFRSSERKFLLFPQVLCASKNALKSAFVFLKLGVLHDAGEGG